VAEDADQYADTAFAAWQVNAADLTVREAFAAGHSVGWGAGYRIGVRDGADSTSQDA